jgi:hypothetical protein
MKKQILLVFIICSSLYGVVKGQNLSAGNIEFGNREIYVLGTFHFREHDFEKYPQDISREIKRAIEYMPDIVCVEWIDKDTGIVYIEIQVLKRVK